MTTWGDASCGHQHENERLMAEVLSETDGWPIVNALYEAGIVMNNGLKGGLCIMRLDSGLPGLAEFIDAGRPVVGSGEFGLAGAMLGVAGVTIENSENPFAAGSTTIDDVDRAVPGWTGEDPASFGLLEGEAGTRTNLHPVQILIADADLLGRIVDMDQAHCHCWNVARDGHQKDCPSGRAKL